MKIAFVIGLYPFDIGGAEMQAREIALSLSTLGHSIHYISYTPKRYSSNEFEVFHIPTRSKFDIFHVGTKRKIYKALDYIKPDVVYHRAFVPYSNYIANWCKAKNIAFYFHNADIYTLTRKNDSLYNIIYNCRLKYTLENATGVICQNEEQFNALKSYRLRKVQIIYNVQRANTTVLKRNKKTNIVWIGKFESLKQPKVFVDFIKRYTNPLVEFTIFSSKCPRSEENQRLLEIINNDKRVTMFEDKNNDYINDFLCNKATLLINTSVSEGISNTFIQAWMRGVPVISLNSNPEGWFDSNELGGFCSGDSYMIDKLVDKYTEKEYYNNVSKRVVEFANNKFSPEIIIPQLCYFMNI